MPSRQKRLMVVGLHVKPDTQKLEILRRSVADVAKKGHCHMVAIVAMIAVRTAAVRVEADMHA